MPFADQGLNKIPYTVTDRQALLVGDIFAMGYWVAKTSEITKDDPVHITGADPTGICTLLCVMLKNPKRIIVCEKDKNRIKFVNAHYPNVLTVTPEKCLDFVRENSEHGGEDVVFEVAGSENTFELAWQCALRMQSSRLWRFTTGADFASARYLRQASDLQDQWR